ncbi:MAG: DNA-binding domain-containing protein [Bacteroidales bacterium]
MNINYVLHLNLMTPDPLDCRAVVVNRTNYHIEDVVKQITGEGSILKETECNAVINAFMKRIGTNLAEGISFQSEYFNVGIEISGVFTNDKDKFDPERHVVYPNLIPGKAWKESLASAKLEKQIPEENKPKPESLVDLKSKTNDQMLTPGGMAELMGQMLKIDETVPDEGIYLIAVNGGLETKVTYLYANYPKNLQFEVPASLVAGDYKIEIRNRAHKGKVLRSGVLEYTLNVA